MTIDDENSIYVGGLPYSATEDSVRRVFSLYGSIVAVKIINDRGTRGKCYCFVTFRNPRSVADAINDMNGQTMDGRILRVNEVTSRGGRSSISGYHFRQSNDRGMDGRSRLDKGRKRDREYDLDRDRYRERYINESRELDASQEFSEMREIIHEDVHDHDGMKDRYIEREDKDLAENKAEHQNNNDFHQERGRDVDWNQDRGMDGSNVNAKTIHGIDYDSRKGNSSYKDRCSRENSLDLGDDFDDEGKDQLERLIHKRDELRKEISRMEESLGEQHVLELQKKHKKLEEALNSARKLSAERRKQLTKVYKSFLQVKTYAEKVKSSEQELQYHVDAAALESDACDDLA